MNTLRCVGSDCSELMGAAGLAYTERVRGPGRRLLPALTACLYTELYRPR